jgi:PAS domain S-box-containing protein
MTESGFRRLLLRFALTPVLALCGFIGILGYQWHRITVDRSQGSQATTMLMQSETLLQSMVDQETGIRGYLVTHDRSFLEPHDRAVATFHSELATMAALDSGNPVYQADIASIASSFTTFDAINQQLLQPNLPPQSVVPLLKQQKQAMDTLRAELSGITAKERTVRDSRRTEISTLLNALPRLGIGGGVAVAILLILHGAFVFQDLAREFRRQLRESEVRRESLHTTLHSIGDAVIVCDSAGLITLMNPTAESLTGWTRDQAVGQPLDQIFQIINEHTRNPVENPVTKVLRAGQIVELANHTLLLRRDGAEISIDDSGAPIRDHNNTIVGVVLVFRDIESRRKAERDLELRTAELESLLFYSPAAFASFDRSHRYMRVNRAMAEMNGVPAHDHLGKTLQEIAPANVPSLETLIDEVFRNRAAIQREFVGETVHDPGVERQWIAWFYPVLTEHAEGPVSVGVIALETTDRWRAQESLVRSEKLAAVGRLAASIAHEMNNPLASVTNLLYLIALDPDIHGQTREFVDRANIELARVSNIARQTLRFAKRSTAASLVDLNDLANSVLLLFSSRISQNHIQARVRVRGTPKYFGHANELMQLLTNLVSNALDALAPHGRLVLAMQQAREWSTGREGISITVADSGTGIPAVWRSKVWEPFFTTKPETGTGLGLWLVEEMARKDGGSVRMRTSTQPPRNGATFRIYLPSVDE